MGNGVDRNCDWLPTLFAKKGEKDEARWSIAKAKMLEWLRTPAFSPCDWVIAPGEVRARTPAPQPARRPTLPFSGTHIAVVVAQTGLDPGLKALLFRAKVQGVKTPCSLRVSDPQLSAREVLQSEYRDRLCSCSPTDDLRKSATMLRPCIGSQSACNRPGPDWGHGTARHAPARLPGWRWGQQQSARAHQTARQRCSPLP